MSLKRRYQDDDQIHQTRSGRKRISLTKEHKKMFIIEENIAKAHNIFMPWTDMMEIIPNWIDGGDSIVLIGEYIKVLHPLLKLLNNPPKMKEAIIRLMNTKTHIDAYEELYNMSDDAQPKELIEFWTSIN
jgi:hypothetical protein